MRRFDCLKHLSAWLDDETITVTSLSGVAHEWAYLREEGPNFCGLNMGMCVPFAVGLSLAFPKRKIVALDGDGSLLLDTSSLITVADVNPPNLLIVVFDNESYFSRTATATARLADLEQIARGAGLNSTATIRTIEEFDELVKRALEGAGLKLFVAKVDRGSEPVDSHYNSMDGRPMKEAFVNALRRHPDYRGR